MTPEEGLSAVEMAKDARDIFPMTSAYESIYKRMLALVHPDRHPTQQNRAAEAAAKLAQLFHSVNEKSPKVAAKIGRWTVDSPMEKGDVADLYVVTSDSQEGVLKIARDAADNDLMDAELSCLRSLSHASPESYRRYVPTVLDHFEGSGRRVNVLVPAKYHYSLAQIKSMMPGNIPFRHIVWMMNRLLSCIGFVERAGWVHGGITPDHILYEPKGHGMMLVGWCSAVNIAANESVRIMANEWSTRGIYPKEVLRKWSCGAGTDIFMAAKSMLYAADQVPERFRNLFGWCTAEAPAARPRDTWDLQDLWKATAEEEYGKPAFVELAIPSV